MKLAALILTAFSISAQAAPPPTHLVCSYSVQEKGAGKIFSGRKVEPLVAQHRGALARIGIPMDSGVILHAVGRTGESPAEASSLFLSAWDYAARMELARVSSGSDSAKLSAESATHRITLDCELK